MMVFALLVVASSNTLQLPLEGSDDPLRRTTEADAQRILVAVGASSPSEQGFRVRSRALVYSDNTCFLTMFWQGAQLEHFSRTSGYYRDTPFDSSKPDKIRTRADFETRIRSFFTESGLNWKEIQVKDLRLLLEHESSSFTDGTDQRRLYSARVVETSSDPRQGPVSLHSAQITVDAQHGHLISFAASYLPPAGPWRLTVSEASARQVAMAEWNKRGLAFKPEQVTLQPKWIRTNLLFDYQPDEVLIAGWSVEARRNPSDKELAALIWVHGETGKIVYSVVPFRSTGE